MRNDIRFPVPPVCTAYWSSRDWDRWILNHGRAPVHFSLHDAEQAVARNPSQLGQAALTSAKLHAADGDHEEAQRLIDLAVEFSS